MRNAMEQFERAAALNPGDAAAHLNLGIVYGEVGRYDDALREFGRALELNPANAAAQVNRGVVLMKQGNQAEAISAFEKALVMGESSTPLHYNLAVCYEYADGIRYGQGFNAAKSVEHYMKVLEREPGNAVVRYNLGMVYLHTGDLELAEGSLRKASEIDPEMADAFSQLGTLLLKKRNYHGAVKNLLEAQRCDSRLPLTPALVEAYSGLGQFFLDNGGYEDARKNCEEVLRLDPSRASAHAQLGRAHRGLRRYAEALDCFYKAQSLDPALPVNDDLAETYCLWGDQLVSEGLPKVAAGQYENALRLKPDYGACCAKLARIYHRETGERGKAIYLYRKALAAGPPIPEADRLRRELADAVRGDDGLVERYRQLVARNTGDATVRYNLAVFLQGSGDLDGAIEEYTEVLRIDPGNSFARYNLGLAYQGKGARSAALREYKSALDSNPQYARAHYALGRLYEELGAFEKAREEYERALATSPDYADAHLALGLVLSNKLGDRKKGQEHMKKYQELNPRRVSEARPKKENAAPAAMP
jgi:tetratricopeptide (TPR) repeat protein